MPEVYLTIFFISVLLIFLGSGVWVGISMIGVSTIGMMMFTSRPVGDAMATTMWSMGSSWSLTALPLFVWMGEILFRTKLSENLFKGLSPWLSKLPGGLIHINILGCAIFAAISGSSAATVATVGKMSIPELRKRNYPESFLLGTLAGSGTLGLLIPPSIILIIYGVTVEEFIAKLFIAGIIPGIGLALLFMIYVVGWSLRNKKIMPIISEDFLYGKNKAIRATTTCCSFNFCCNRIYLCRNSYGNRSSFTWCFGSIGIILFSESLTKESFSKSLLGATKTSCMIAFILAGSSFLTLAMAFTGLPKNLAVFIDTLQLSPYMLLLVLTHFLHNSWNVFRRNLSSGFNHGNY